MNIDVVVLLKKIEEPLIRLSQQQSNSDNNRRDTVSAKATEKRKKTPGLDTSLGKKVC